MTEMFEYLVKTLSRTRRKDYENYVVNRIWSLLNDTEIKPTTQQYCRRNNGRYALLDMYFPQLGIAVECDEPAHNSLDASARDNQRSLEIRAVSEENRVGAVLEHGIDIKRISVSRGILQVNSQVDDVVAQLRARKRELVEKGHFCLGIPRFQTLNEPWTRGRSE